MTAIGNDLLRNRNRLKEPLYNRREAVDILLVDSGVLEVLAGSARMLRASLNNQYISALFGQDACERAPGRTAANDQYVGP
jgi:hypothetical protein